MQAIIMSSLILALFYTHVVFAEKNTISSYFNSQEPPADRPVIFAKGIVSLPDRVEEKIAISPDGKEIFFGRHPDGGKGYRKPEVMHSVLKNNTWSKPSAMHFSKEKTLGWPLMHSDGRTLYMEELGGKIAYSNKEKGQWSAVRYILPDVKAEQGFGLAQMTKDNTFYFYDRWGRIAYSSKVVNEKHTKPKPLSGKINPAVEFFVSPENDYIIFTPLNWSNQFHISFKMPDGDWDMPIPFNTYFNSAKWDGKGNGPSVSSDGKYLFFGKRGDIYWVKTDFIEVLREYKRPY